MRQRVWVAVLHVSDPVCQKIISRHGIEEQELRDEVGDRQVELFSVLPAS